MNRHKQYIKNKSAFILSTAVFIFIALTSKAMFHSITLKNKTLTTISNNDEVKINANESQITPSDTTFDLYLLIGQSNMSGRGPITKEFKDQGSPNVLMFNKDDKWVPAKNPLHFDKPSIVGVGPGLSFGISMVKKNSRAKIGLISCAVGGTSIDVWKPGGIDGVTKTHPYDDMLARLKEAQKSGLLKGVIWLQGESDSSPEKAAMYLSKLKDLIERIRTVAGNDELPFVAGELGRYKAQYQNINAVLKHLPQQVSNTVVASSKGLKDKGDKTHFDSPSAKKMGERMAKKMKQLQKKKTLLKRLE